MTYFKLARIHLSFTKHTLRKKCPYPELLWSVFQSEMRENTDQNNSEYGHFLRSDKYDVNAKWRILTEVALPP